MNDFSFAIPYLALVILAIAIHVLRKKRHERGSADVLHENVSAGLTEPPSLHPVIDTVRCIGSGSCVLICPEEEIGIINGKAELINPAHCIGHGACMAACPVDGIKLVFGTSKRGIDIPFVHPNFESNVPGVFIAGELGGMGLIRKAAQQGRQAMDAVRKREGGSGKLDVLIVGAGPAGLSAGLSALEHKMNYRIIEQEDSLGGCVYHYPRNKIAMTAPVELAIIGKVKMGEISKEALLEFWHGVVNKTGLKIKFNEQMKSIELRDDTFIVETTAKRYSTRNIVLAIGRRGTPRRLGVAGEERSKVVYRLIDPEQYRGMAVLVVGGGDSALEAAIALAEQPDTQVTLSYRSDAFSRVKEKNRTRLAQLQDEGRLDVRLKSQVQTIEEHSVAIALGGEVIEIENDAVIVCAGGELPTGLLKKIGIAFETKYGTE